MYGDDMESAGFEVVGAETMPAPRTLQMFRPGIQRMPGGFGGSVAQGFTPGRPILRRPVVAGRRTGMTTGLPLGIVTYAAAAAAGAQLALAQVAQERFVARRLVLKRFNQWVPAAATPLPASQGMPVCLMNLTIGMRSVLAGGAGIPVETFDPDATGGGLLADNVEVIPGLTVTATVQLMIGPVPAAEQISITGYLTGEE